MLRKALSRREAPSRVTNVSPRQARSCLPPTTYPTLLQGIDCQAEGETPSRWLMWSACGTVRTERRTKKASTGSSATGGRPSRGSSPWQAKRRRAVEYRSTGTDNMECKMCTVPSGLTWRRPTRSKTGDRVHPGGQVVQEGVHSLSRLLLQGQQPAVLLRRLEPSHQCRDKIVGQSAGTNHPPHRSRRRRGVEFDHDNRGGRHLSAGGVTGSHNACAWVGSDPASQHQEGEEKSKRRKWH